MFPALLEESATTPRASRVRRHRGIGPAVALCIAFSLGLAACGGGERQDENEVEGEFPVEIVSADFPASQSLAETSDLVLEVRNAGDETIPDLAVTVFTQAEESVPVVDEADAEASEEEDAEATDTEGEAIPESQLDEEVDKAFEEDLENQAAEEEDSEGTSSEDAELDTGGESGTGTGTPPSGAGPFSVLSEQEGLAIPSRPVWILEQGYPREEDTAPNTPPPGEITGGSGSEAAQTNTFSFGAMEPGDTKTVVFRVTPVRPGDYTVRYRVAAGLQGNAVAVNEDGSVPEGEFVVVISDEPPQTRVDDNGKVVPIDPDDIIGQAGSDEQKQELNP
jgi:hypothetical protein